MEAVGERVRGAETLPEEEEKCDLCVIWGMDLVGNDGPIRAGNAIRLAQGGIRPLPVGVMPEAGLEADSGVNRSPGSPTNITQDSPISPAGKKDQDQSLSDVSSTTQDPPQDVQAFQRNSTKEGLKDTWGWFNYIDINKPRGYIRGRKRT